MAVTLDEQVFLLVKYDKLRYQWRPLFGRGVPSLIYMPSPNPRRIKTIDGIKKALGRELIKQHGKGVRVEVSYRYEQIPRERREWNWTWERLGQMLVGITEEAIGKDLVNFQKLPNQRIYKIRFSISRKRSAYKDSDWDEIFEGNKQELFDWWQEYYGDAV